MSEGDAELEARLAEQEAFEPPAEFVEQANVTDEGIYEAFEEEWPDCWERAAEMLDWFDDYEQVLDD
jgi:acetyl-CoA synthetase